MFQINAILNPSALDDVLHGLHDENIHGVTVSNVLGKGCLANLESKLSEKMMIIVVVANNSYKEKAMEAIRANAQDIGHGAGKMWVTPVLEAERIRTGEKDLDALSQARPKGTSRSIDVDVYSPIDTPAS